MLQLKPLHKASIPKAIDKAAHYRLLNEPWQTESICRDILDVEPEHQPAILNLILALTDQFGQQKPSCQIEAKELCRRLTNEYDKKYYRGLIEERTGKVAIRRTTPRARYIAYEHYRNAMNFYEEAEKIHPEDNEDAVLRWNACARSIQEYKLKRSPEEDHIQPFME